MAGQKVYLAGTDDNWHRRGRPAVPEGTTPIGGLPPVPPTGRAAVHSEVFYEHIAGVNCLYKNASSTNVHQNWQAVSDYIIDLGFRTVRDRIHPDATPARANQRLAYPYLAAAGVKLHTSIGVCFVTDNQHNSDCVAEMATQYGSEAENMWRSVGGWNEPNDAPQAANWQDLTKANQQDVYAKIKANAFTNSILVAGPALKDGEPTLQNDFTILGATGISSFVDIGDFHRYPGGIPSTRLDERLGWARTAFPAPLPMYCTEGGFNTGLTALTGGNPFDQNTQATYMLRWFGEHYLRGVRPFLFELMDDPDLTVWEHNWGLVAVNESLDPADWTTKVSYTAIKRYFSRLADGTTPYTPVPLDITVSGGDGKYKDILLQKRGGKWILLMWRDVSVWNTSTRTPITVAPQTITFTLSTAMPSAVYNPRTSATAVATLSSRTTHTVSLAGDLLMVEIG